MSDQYDRGEQKRYNVHDFCSPQLSIMLMNLPHHRDGSSRPPCAHQNSSPTPTETACLHTFSVPHVYSSLLFCAW